MSYRLDVFSCDHCGAVWFDPPERHAFERPKGFGDWNPQWPCKLMYSAAGPNPELSTVIVAALSMAHPALPCGGTVKRVAILDADVFDWFDPA